MAYEFTKQKLVAERMAQRRRWVVAVFSGGAIAFVPAVLVLGALVVINPALLTEWGLPACLGIGGLVGATSAAAAYMLGRLD